MRGSGLESRGDAIAAEAVALRLVAVSPRPELVGRALAERAPCARLLASRGAAPEALRGLELLHPRRRPPGPAQPGRGARRYFTEALGVRQAALATGHRDIGYTLLNLASVTEPGAARDDLLARALEIFDAELGVVHPATIEARITARPAGRAGRGVVDPPDRLRRARAVLARRPRASHSLPVPPRPRRHRDRRRRRRRLGLPRRRRAVRDVGRAPVRPRGHLAGRLPRHLAGPVDDNGAVDHLQATLLRMPDATWSNEEIAELRLVLGQNLLARGRPVEARLGP